MLPNTFDEKTKQDNISRLEKLSAETTPKWGKMNAAQMLAHVNVAYKMALDENTPITRGFKRFLITLLAKNMVVGPKPYPKNGRTSPDFIIAGERDFEAEKAKLIGFLNETNEKGTAYFDNKVSQSFGRLTAQEWSNLFQKHLDHHFNQFGI